MSAAPKTRAFPSRATFLLVLGADPERWARRYGIAPFTHPCAGCGAPSTTSVPFASGDHRGLMAPVCECKHPTPPYALVRADGGDIL